MKTIERKRGRILGIILTITMCMLMIQMSVFAASDTDNSGNEREVYWDEEYIYFRYEGDWSYWMTTNIFVNNSSANLGRYNMIRIGQNNLCESNTISVRDGWDNPIEGATGNVVSSGPVQDWSGNAYAYRDMTWSIKVPWSIYEDYGVDNLYVTWDASIFIPSLDELDPPPADIIPGEIIEEIEVTEPEASEPEVTEPEATEPEATINPDSILTSGIVIDGYYEDWTSYPVTEITYQGNNGKDNHGAQIYTDGENLYAHFMMADTYNGRMQIQRWYLSINGQQFVLQIQAEKNGSVNWGHIPNGKGIHTNLKCFLGDNPALLDSNVAYTIHTPGNNEHSEQGSSGRAKGDEIEFSINLDDLARLTGIPVEDMRTIAIKNDNIGTAEVMTAGTSSGPIIGVAICVVVGFGGYLVYRKKNNKTAK